jgi:hypothetical protein
MSISVSHLFLEVFMFVRSLLRTLAIFAAMALVNTAFAVDMPNPLYWLKMDGNYSNSGTGSGAVAFQQGTAGLAASYVTGHDGTTNGAICLTPTDTGTSTVTEDGTTYTTIANGEGNNLAITCTLPNTGTIAMWYYTKNTVGATYSKYYQELFCNSAGSDKWESWVSCKSGNVGARTNDADSTGEAGSGWNNDATVFGISIPGWHHIAMTWEHESGSTSVTRSIYVDGSLAANGATTSTTTEYWCQPGDTFAIGGNYGNTFANGYYDDVRIYGSALTASQVGSMVPEPGTFAMGIAGLLGILAYVWRKRN